VEGSFNIERKEQLLVLAADPNEDAAECAIADLFKEFSLYLNKQS
jgi:hypothetical protein